MQVTPIFLVVLVLGVSGCSMLAPQARSGNAALPETVAERITPLRGTLTTLYSFQGQPDGADPQGRVTIYHLCTNVCSTEILGNTSAGGSNDAGTIYSLFSPRTDEGFTENVRLSYTPSETGSDPTGPVVGHGYYGPFFGAASHGGKHDDGTIAEVKGLKGKNAVLAFNQRDGAFPAGGPAYSGGHTFYLATNGGGRHDLGAIVSLTYTPGTDKPITKVVYSFTGKSDGAHPNSELWTATVYGSPIYGTTAGSKRTAATVFGYSPGQGLTTVYTFATSQSGGTPAGITPYEYTSSKKKQVFVGTTVNGGSSGYGTLYALRPKGSKYTKVTLHTFAGGSADGAYPYGPPILVGQPPELYVVTAGGGSKGCGTIFSYDFSSGEHTVRYSFKCGADGADPEGPIVSDGLYGGLLYGTTSAGGTSGNGTVFSFLPP